MTTTIKERPIIMSGESVRAIMDLSKWQTRRVIKPQPQQNGSWNGEPSFLWEHEGLETGYCHTNRDALIRLMLPLCPYGRVGDRLRIKEAVIQIGHERTKSPGRYRWPNFDSESGRRWFDSHCVYRADMKRSDILWDEPHGTLAAMFMPRWASRLTLEITDIRVQRVQEISEADAIAEGCRGIAEFLQRWDDLNAKRGFPWSNNPWCWALTFKRIGGAA